jgi:hypothetical protein
MTNHADDLEEVDGPKKKSKHHHRKVIHAILPLGDGDLSLCVLLRPTYARLRTRDAAVAGGIMRG